MTELRADHPFSITHGGPCYHLLQRLHLVDRHGAVRWPWLALALWASTTIMSLIPLALRGQIEPTLVDLSVHARFLVAIPLLMIAERLLEKRCRISMRQFRAGRFANRATVDALIDRAEHLRDSRIVEGVILGLAVLLGQAALWGWLEPPGLVHGMETTGQITLARVGYAGIALPVFQFLLVRWLWRWAIWSYVLVRLSRLKLSLNALHPDNAAGLGFLAEPIDAIAVYVASVASIAAAAWTEQILRGHATMPTFVPAFSGFLVVAVAVAAGPLLMFAGHLYRARRRDVPLHAELALHYVRNFRHKWMQQRATEPVLGTSDIQSLNDLGGGFHTTENTRLVPLDLRSLLAIAVGALLPMVPVVLTSVPLREVGERLGKALLGGLPI